MELGNPVKTWIVEPVETPAERPDVAPFPEKRDPVEDPDLIPA